MGHPRRQGTGPANSGVLGKRIRTLCAGALAWGCLVLSAPNVVHAACDEPPPPVRDIFADRFYVDTASSIADRAIIARNRSSLATLDHTLTAIVAMAEKVSPGTPRARPAPAIGSPHGRKAARCWAT